MFCLICSIVGFKFHMSKNIWIKWNSLWQQINRKTCHVLDYFRLFFVYDVWLNVNISHNLMKYMNISILSNIFNKSMEKWEVKKKLNAVFYYYEYHTVNTITLHYLCILCTVKVHLFWETINSIDMFNHKCNWYRKVWVMYHVHTGNWQLTIVAALCTMFLLFIVSVFSLRFACI